MSEDLLIQYPHPDQLDSWTTKQSENFFDNAFNGELAEYKEYFPDFFNDDWKMSDLKENPDDTEELVYDPQHLELIQDVIANRKEWTEIYPGQPEITEFLDIVPLVEISMNNPISENELRLAAQTIFVVNKNTAIVEFDSPIKARLCVARFNSDTDVSAKLVEKEEENQSIPMYRVPEELTEEKMPQYYIPFYQNMMNDGGDDIEIAWNRPPQDVFSAVIRSDTKIEETVLKSIVRQCIEGCLISDHEVRDQVVHFYSKFERDLFVAQCERVAASFEVNARAVKMGYEVKLRSMDGISEIHDCMPIIYYLTSFGDILSWNRSGSEVTIVFGTIEALEMLQQQQNIVVGGLRLSAVSPVLAF